MKIFSVLFVTGMIFIIGGCSEESTTPVVLSDEEAIQMQVATIDSVADYSASDEASINDGEAKDWEYSAFPKLAVPIDPLRWGRIVDNVNRQINVTIIGDTVAVADLTRSINGRIVISAMYDTSVNPTMIVKQFQTEVHRRIRFERIARTRDPRLNWIPFAITPVYGETDTTDYEIVRLEMYTPYDTIEVTDPLMHWFRLGRWNDGIPVLAAGDSMMVRVRVRSTNQLRESAVIRHSCDHRFNYRFRNRMGIVDSTFSGNMYEREYENRFMVRIPTTANIGRYNVIADVMSYNSLHDDQAPYMNMFMGIPYIVVKKP